nr:thioredoxin domain-containing protein [Candidatus Njordarchaeota archaeon]
MGEVVDVDTSNFLQEVLQSDILTFVEFWHETCPWCVKLAPILEEVAREYKGRVRFVKFNILASPYNKELAAHLGIMSTPTMVFFCNGRAIQGIAGFMTKGQLVRTIDDMLQRHRQCLEQSTEVKQDYEKFYA